MLWIAYAIIGIVVFISIWIFEDDPILIGEDELKLLFCGIGAVVWPPLVAALLFIKGTKLLISVLNQMRDGSKEAKSWIEEKI